MGKVYFTQGSLAISFYKVAEDIEQRTGKKFTRSFNEDKIVQGIHGLQRENLAISFVCPGGRRIFEQVKYDLFNQEVENDQLIEDLLNANNLLENLIGGQYGDVLDRLFDNDFEFFLLLLNDRLTNLFEYEMSEKVLFYLLYLISYSELGTSFDKYNYWPVALDQLRNYKSSKEEDRRNAISWFLETIRGEINAIDRLRKEYFIEIESLSVSFKEACRSVANQLYNRNKVVVISTISYSKTVFHLANTKLANVRVKFAEGASNLKNLVKPIASTIAKLSKHMTEDPISKDTLKIVLLFGCSASLIVELLNFVTTLIPPIRSLFSACIIQAIGDTYDKMKKEADKLSLNESKTEIETDK